MSFLDQRRPRRSQRLRAAARPVVLLVLAMNAGLAWPAQTQAPAASPTPAEAATPAPPSSGMDAPLFYQVLIGEMEMNSGRVGAAYELLLDAARRTADETLFRRAVDIATQARAGDQALAAVRAWRTALPASAEAQRVEIQLLLALNRPAEIVEPLRALLAQAQDLQRPGLIAAVPRLLERQGDARRSATIAEQVLLPYLARDDTRMPTRIALARLWSAAGDTAQALALARQAQAEEPQAIGPALVAIELIGREAGAEALLDAYLAQPSAQVEVRLAYVQALSAQQRYQDAVRQLEVITAARPDLPAPWLTLGALRLDMRELAAADDALQRYVTLVQAGGPPEAPASADAQGSGPDAGGDDAEPEGSPPGLVQAWLMLAQVAEQRGDAAASERWLSLIDDPRRALEVQSRRAVLLARQGQIEQARQLVRSVPERQPGDGRAKLLAEVQVLREVKRWNDAYALLDGAQAEYPDDIDLIYEQAMLAERIDRFPDMERLLRRIISLRPDHHHAHNALGYSLADRNERLPEARQLIQRALELAPGDPFITDSLGWVEFRMGNFAEAVRLLKLAYASRPDTEIAAHLGEVLWVSGQRDEARRIWREAQRRDGTNDVLRATLSRLKVDL